MATIFEVAARAGVSPATVSRVYNGTPVSEEKSRLVRQAAEELNFVPNRTARALRRQASEVIALIIPDIENPYFTSLARGVEDVAQAAGYSVVLCNSDDDPAKEATYVDIAALENMAGVIIAAVSEQPRIERMIDRNRPVVAVDRPIAFEVDEVIMANRDSGEVAARSLIEAGYRRIACITGPADVGTARERAAGWEAVVTEAGQFDRPEDYLRFANFRVEGGRETLAEVLALDPPPDAVVAANNLMGVGALQLLSERGLIPPKFGVAVIGELPFTTLTPTAITLVRLPAREMGTRAATLLLERINGDKSAPREVIVQHTVEPATALR
ncbi:LacI family DNA-binding transcriptional regulator [Microlunatus speluncae]|uniref:LacI family DNA-binding transcriptional regulator n=1 Tax=Microlunatus speluncae TaxID=2594267 RepID=UPI0012665D69|nr:LacI family DNA-binding transcriptional regulator [Microlunatus speluncae]